MAIYFRQIAYDNKKTRRARDWTKAASVSSYELVEKKRFELSTPTLRT